MNASHRRWALREAVNTDLEASARLMQQSRTMIAAAGVQAARALALIDIANESIAVTQRDLRAQRADQADQAAADTDRPFR